MTISEYNSSKITILNFSLIIMMLYRHAPFSEAYDGYSLASSVQNFIGLGICGVTNAMFFCISGFLFFNNTYNAIDCIPKIKKRIKTLLLPYIIWNCIFVLWYFLLDKIPNVNQFVNSNILSNFDSVWSSFSFLFLNPANFTLWFIRDLFVMILFSPLLFCLIKYLKWWLLFLLILISPLVHYSNIVYFVFGGVFAFCGKQKFFDNSKNIYLMLLCITIYIGNAIIYCYTIERPVYFNTIASLFSVIAIWLLYDYIAQNRVLSKSKYLKHIVGYSFFIYLSHEPTINILKKLSIIALGTNNTNIILLYLLIPIIYAAIAILCAMLIKKITPHLYSILVGGRL